MIGSKRSPIEKRFAAAALVLGTCCFSVQARAQIDPDAAAEPSSCLPLEVLLRDPVLPRNVFGIPIRTGSPMFPGIPTLELVSAAGATVATEISVDKEGGTLFVRPASPPPQGTYTLRYQERCRVADGGQGTESSEFTVNYPITFGPEAPLPTTAGTVRIEQRVDSQQPPIEAEVRTDGGACEVQTLRWMSLAFFWTPSPELVPFQDVTEVSVEPPNGLTAFFKGYGEPHSASLLVLCTDDAGLGFVGQRGSLTLRARLAGATQDLLPREISLQVECPAPTFVGKCNEPDASDEAHDPPDANRWDGGSEAGQDVGPRLDASDASSETVALPNPPQWEPGDERRDDVTIPPRWQGDATHESRDDAGSSMQRDSGANLPMAEAGDALVAEAGTVSGCSCRTVPNRTISASTAFLAGLGLLVFAKRRALRTRAPQRRGEGGCARRGREGPTVITADEVSPP